MGGEFLTAPSETVRRRVLAGVLALAINSGLIALLLFLPRPPVPTPDPETVDIVLVTLPPNLSRNEVRRVIAIQIYLTQ